VFDAFHGKRPNVM